MRRRDIFTRTGINAGSEPREAAVPRLLQMLINARVLAVALVLEVGFVIGLYAGTATSLNALQWGGAGVALVGASLMAAMVFAWPEPSPVKAKASPKA